MRVFGREKKIALGPVIGRMADDFFKPGIKGNRIQRHLNVDRGRKLGAYAAHTLARRSLALRAFALDHQHALAACMREMPRDAGADDAAADDNYVRRLHAIWALAPPTA